MMFRCFEILLACCAVLTAASNAGDAAEDTNRGLWNNDNGCPVQPICESVLPGGCTRYVKGFDITGVSNTEVFTFADGVRNKCDCFRKCFEYFETCSNYIFKFTDNSGHRTCTLYSNFNLPPGTNSDPISLAIDVAGSTGLGVIADNPQDGGLVPHCTKDGVHGFDPGCYSGPLWALDNGKFLC